MYDENADGMRIGYARVSTEDQNLDLQIDALKAAGCREDMIFRESVSAAAKRRPQLDLAIKMLRKGDTLIVWRLDRFARSIKDLTHRLGVIEKKGATFRSLNENLDLTTAGGRLILHVMGAIAEFERQLISARTSAGIQAKLRRGWRPGRKAMLPEKSRELAYAQRLRSKGESADAIVEALADKYDIHVSRTTIYNNTTAPLDTKR